MQNPIKPFRKKLLNWRTEWCKQAKPKMQPWIILPVEIYQMLLEAERNLRALFPNFRAVNSSLLVTLSNDFLHWVEISKTHNLQEMRFLLAQCQEDSAMADWLQGRNATVKRWSRRKLFNSWHPGRGKKGDQGQEYTHPIYTPADHIQPGPNS